LDYRFYLVTHQLVGWLTQVNDQIGEKGDLPDAFW